MKLFKPCLLYGAVPQRGGGRVLKTRDRDERPVGSNPTCVVLKGGKEMDTSVMSRTSGLVQSIIQIDLDFLNHLDGEEKKEYFIMENPESVVDSARVDISPISNFKIRIPLSFYPFTVMQIDRADENLIMEKQKYIKYIMKISSPEKFNSLLQKEYEEAKIKGFNGDLNDYLSVRDYT